MARTNLEDSLRTDGHLGKLARIMGWCESKAGGRLWFFYRHTQAARIVVATISQIATAVLTDFDDEAEVKRWCLAMVSAKLAELQDDGSIRILGNEKHIARFEGYGSRAKAGGIASGASRQRRATENLNVGVTSKFDLAPKSNQTGTLLPPSSFLPSSSAPASASASEGNPRALERITEEANQEAEERPNLPAKIQLPPQTNNLAEIATSQIPIERAIALVHKYKALVTKRNLAPHPMVLPGETAAARQIIALAGGNDAIANVALERYVAHNGNKYWAEQKWPLSLLAKQRDFDQAIQLASIVRSATPNAKNEKHLT